MSRLRLFIAWLLMAALPLQGFAAATMLFCDQGAVSAQAAYEEHAAPGHHHGYDEDTSAQGSSDPAQHAHGAKVLGADKADKGHACSICASCCHVVALSYSPSPIPLADSPSAELPQPHVRLLTRASPRPDKPPRA